MRVTTSRRKMEAFAESLELDRRAIPLIVAGMSVEDAYSAVLEEESSAAASGAVQPETLCATAENR